MLVVQEANECTLIILCRMALFPFKRHPFLSQCVASRSTPLKTILHVYHVFYECMLWSLFLVYCKLGFHITKSSHVQYSRCIFNYCFLIFVLKLYCVLYLMFNIQWGWNAGIGCYYMYFNCHTNILYLDWEWSHPQLKSLRWRICVYKECNC